MKLLLRSLTAFLPAFTAFSAFAHQGGSDAGGGGAVSEPHASTRDILHGAAISKTAIWMWLNQKEYDFRVKVAEDPKAKEQNPELTKIFLGKTTIFDLLPKITIQLSNSEPCYNRYGQPWDGSIYPRGPVKPFTICISAYNLQNKLTHDDYDFETAALVLHEISHFLGTTEAEAIRLQRACQEDIIKFDLDSTWETIQRYSVDAYHVVQLIQAQPRELTNLRSFTNQLFLDMSKINPTIALSGVFKDGPLSFMRAKERDQLATAFAKLYELDGFACINDPLSPNAKECEKDFDELFSGSNSVRASKIILAMGAGSSIAEMSDQFPQFDPLITRASNLNDYGVQLKEIAASAQDYIKLLQKFIFPTSGFQVFEK